MAKDAKTGTLATHAKPASAACLRHTAEGASAYHVSMTMIATMMTSPTMPPGIQIFIDLLQKSCASTRVAACGHVTENQEADLRKLADGGRSGTVQRSEDDSSVATSLMLAFSTVLTGSSTRMRQVHHESDTEGGGNGPLAHSRETRR